VTNHIAIFGGSFDPPHIGHVRLVEAALLSLDIDALWLIPTGNPVHKTLSGHANHQQRITWLEDIFGHQPRVVVKTWETESQKPAPAIDTLRRFQGEFPDVIPTWLMGMDSYLDLPHWMDYPQHVQLCNLAVFRRVGQEYSDIPTPWQEISLSQWQLHPPKKAGHILHLDGDLPDVSSSQIRSNPALYQHLLPISTCNAILACYASPSKLRQKRETHD